MIPFLQTGDLIWICSPAKQIEGELLYAAKKRWEDHGYRVEFSPNAFGQHHYFSGTKEQRLSDFQEGLDRTDVKAIVCARGGYGAVQLLQHLDWTRFQSNPKWILGFSDITNFHLELAQMDFPGIHATMPLNYGENSKATIESMFKAVSGENYEIKAPGFSKNIPGDFVGKVLGGNLSIVYSLLTRHPLEIWKDKILYLEDVGEQLYHFDRMFHALKFSGVLNQVKAFVIGSFTEVKDTELGFGKGIEDLILDHVGNLNIPVGFGFPAGHQDDNQTVMMGVEAQLIVRIEGSHLIFNAPNT